MQKNFEKDNLSGALKDIKGLIEGRNDLASMSSDILDLTDRVDDKQLLAENQQMYQIHLDDNKNCFAELSHEQIVSIVSQALKDHLGEWLNQNLPEIVKKEVEKQIQILIHKENKG